MLSWKVVLISAAVMFTALGLKASVPVATANLPLVWSFFVLCFKPPYLFVILNAIIISIVASSRFHRHSNHPPQLIPPPPVHSSPVLVIPESPPPLQSPPFPDSQILEVKAVLVNGSTVQEEEEQQEEQEEEEQQEEQEEEEEKKVIDEEMTPKITNSTEILLSPAEKPLVSARFPHRKFLKSTSEGGRALRVVAKAKRHETLENTWKAITEGRSMPLSRHMMKKCDTWQSRSNMNVSPPPENMSEVETFDDAVSVSGGRLRKEPSLSQDELNRRVEAFIRKFNEEMRLQRQQSLEQYMQMINRGAA